MSKRRGRSRNGPAPSSNGEYPISTESLVAEIHETADRLLRDGATRGDVKILGRTLKELRYAFKVFAPYRNCRKVAMFGSARSKSEDAGYVQAVAFGRALAEAGWMILTGASSGIMEAGHVGAGREHSMGVNILLPFEQGVNPVIAGDPKVVHLKYFFTRKLLFVKETDAVAVFPGGFGTMDEAFELLTLVQTGKREMVPIVFVDAPGGDYWLIWDTFVQKYLLGRGYISESDLALYKVTDNLQEAVAEITEFYRVFHSMRFVGDALVLRLDRPLPAPLIDAFNFEFRDLLIGGEFVQSAALAEEASDEHLKDLPRLSFHFNRRAFGRLRQLINAINRSEIPPEIAGPSTVKNEEKEPVEG